MVNTNHKELLEQILALLDTACQANLELLEAYAGRNAACANQLLDDLSAAANAVRTAQEPLLPQLEYAYTAEMLENVSDTLEEIRRSIQLENMDRAAMKMEFQLFPFLRQLREAFYFWGAVYPDKERMDRYYREEFAEHHKNLYVGGEPAPFKVSVVIPAYNHLETTQKCVEQLLRETDFKKLPAELILIDHGSHDGTLEYFESLHIGKVIHFKRNARMNMFLTMFQVCQGEFLAYVSNDVLVTHHWAEILLQCFASDPNIIAAVPATPNISNLQMLNSPTNDPEEFVIWANRQNGSDASRWNDRARLMPPIGMYRVGAVNQIGFADPYFYSMEFWDDDFSLRARRAGYRQLVCEDVACYHFGSVTGKQAQMKEGTLTYGRELFQKKHGVDAWSNGFCYDYSAVHLFKQAVDPARSCAVLGLDCGMGDTPLQFQNELRHLHQKCELYQLTSQKAYLADIAPHAAQCAFAPGLADGLASSFENKKFNFAYLGREIEQYEDFSELLQEVSRRLVPGGWFEFTCANPFFAPTLHTLLQFSVPGGRCVLAAPEQIRTEAEKYFSQVQMLPLESPVNGLEEFAARHFGESGQLPQITRRLGASRFYFLCRA